MLPLALVCRCYESSLLSFAILVSAVNGECWTLWQRRAVLPVLTAAETTAQPWRWTTESLGFRLLCSPPVPSSSQGQPAARPCLKKKSVWTGPIKCFLFLRHWEVSWMLSPSWFSQWVGCGRFECSPTLLSRAGISHTTPPWMSSSSPSNLQSRQLALKIIQESARDLAVFKTKKA